MGGAASMLSGPRRSEIFVDVVERLSVTFNSAGYVLTSEIDGAIQCKSFLAGNPQARGQHACVVCVHAHRVVCMYLLTLSHLTRAGVRARRFGWR